MSEKRYLSPSPHSDPPGPGLASLHKCLRVLGSGEEYQTSKYHGYQFLECYYMERVMWKGLEALLVVTVKLLLCEAGRLDFSSFAEETPRAA